MNQYNDAPDIEFLLQRISQYDDQIAYRSLFEHYYGALCLFAKRYIEDRDVREDIVQDVFFSVWAKRKFILANTSGKNYLITCVKNMSLNYLRKQGYKDEYINKVRERMPVYAENLDDIYTLNELRALLESALAKLPVEYRIAFEMSRLEGKTSAEIAEVMNISVRTVERYRNKATEIIKEELKDYLPLLFLLFPFA
ncbi:RNA polymerase sigma-70 factor [Bacteroides sp.]